MTQSEMNIMVEELLMKPCYVIDFLPQRVTEYDNIQFFNAVEQYYLCEDKVKQIANSFIHIILKSLCYFEFSVYKDGLIENPSCQDLEKMMKAVYTSQDDCVSILLPKEKSLIQMCSGDLNLSVYNPNEKVTHILGVLAQAEGMFWWQGNNLCQ